MLVAPGDLASTQAKATGKTYEDEVWLLNYAASHPMAIIRYKASDMILLIDAGASYLSVICVRIQAGGNTILAKIQTTHQIMEPSTTFSKS